MNTKKTEKLLDMSVGIVKILLCITLSMVAGVFVYYNIVDRHNAAKEEPLRFIESWTAIDMEGNETTTGRSVVAGKADLKAYTIIATLPDDIQDNEYLFFNIRKDVEVYINGELREDFYEKRDVRIPGGSIKRFYMSVPLNASDSGAEVKIAGMSAVKDTQIVPESFVSTRYGGLAYLMHNYGLSFLLAAIILIFSIVVFIVSIVLRLCYKMKIDMMYGALGIFIISSWIITDSYLFPFVFGVFHVNGIMNYMLCLMIPFALAIYLNSLQRGRYKCSMSIIMIVSAINSIVWPVLHFTGVFPFYKIRNIANVIFAMMAGFAIIILIYDAIKGTVKSYKYTFIGFLGFLICCIIELLLLIFVTTINVPLPMAAGLAFLLVFIVIQQVDDLRKINMEKQHAIDISEAKTRFLASMSHEIRTPINAILGMNEMIMRENKDEIVGGYSRSIKSSGKMLLMLVNDVLDFSRIEAGKLEINNARFHMSDMLYDVISICKERADEKSLALSTELKSEIPNEMVSDEFRIRQILVNLINNAVKYTDKGYVKLILGGKYIDDDNYELSIIVKDTGKGIRIEDQEHLFEAFSRVDLKANANIEGTGLGLAIVKSIVDSMKGSVGVNSEYGVGSEFWVKLPMKYKHKELLKSNFMETRVSGDSEVDDCDFTAPDAKILAVDDNRSNLTIFKLFLKRTGIVPDLCNSGTKAVELCRENKYDLIFLDHMMPQPDGIETLHLIRKDEKSLNKDTKAICLTANAVAGSRQLYMDEGFDDYLTKPLDSSLLEEMVKTMLPTEKVHKKTTPKVPGTIEKNDGSSLENTGADEDSKNFEDFSENDEIVEFEACDIDDETSVNAVPIRDRLTAIEGLDYEKALGFCAGEEELLEEIVADIAAEAENRIERMKKSLAEGDIKSYQIDAHSIKGSMATIGLQDFSDRAKKHEFAAKENNTEFIESDSEEFLKKYAEICRRLV